MFIGFPAIVSEASDMKGTPRTIRVHLRYKGHTGETV